MQPMPKGILLIFDASCNNLYEVISFILFLAFIEINLTTYLLKLLQAVFRIGVYLISPSWPRSAALLFSILCYTV